MQKINKLLFGFIVAGVVILLLQYFLKAEPEVLVTEPVVEVPTAPRNDIESWNWVLSPVSPQGTQFKYPEPLPTKYVTAVEWPPTVSMVAGKLVCEQGSAIGSDGETKRFALRTLDGSDYCVGFSAEGAAGSTYTSYEYSTAQGDYVARVSFTLRTPQCMNYDDPERTVCKTEQALFATDALAVDILSSLTMR